ncbi:efflux transporter outer membrane subunit [Azospira restricta]|uniref:Efflux transporter outer membrane subunit n=1 Tax=Azospira restricta TaxID=404405 RepID=A0A974SNJ2_9RHOO|nr:efflux transporter outer membrane subunit [Azospira restricta]QRJ63579.1 efflux transporter outer membrane subunit [Azospira restricta]
MSKLKQPYFKLAPLAAAALLAGCAVGPDYARPELELPQAWAQRTAAGNAAAAQVADRAGERWWTLYADPLLDRLVDEALAHNADARVAAARVLEAQALAGIAESDRYPTVTAGLSGNRTQSSLKGAMPLPANIPRIQNSYRATVDVAWEVDLWGKYRRADEAARADLLAAESARDAVRLALTAQVAQQYFALLAADAQEATAKRTAAGRDENLALYRLRAEAGLGSEYDLRQIEADAADARARLAELTQARDRAESALALLLGRSPRAVLEDTPERGAPGALPALQVPAGLPSDLLLRRPDLQEAEQRLVAANARIGAARAQYFPSVGLTAYLGSESTAFSDLFSGPAGIFQFAAAITQPIWNAGRIGFNVAAAEARREQALAQYRQAVAAAFKDVRDALAAQRAARDKLEAETTRAAALEKALQQARLRHDAGIASRLEVLDVERNLLAVELARIDSERAARAALADLFKALGGGWPAAAQG